MTSPVAPLPTPEMILPPGWAWIDLTAHLEPQVRSIFADAWGAGPRDSIGPHVRELEQAMLTTLRKAERSGATVLVLPIGTPWQVPMSVSIAFAVVRPEGTGNVALPIPSSEHTVLTTEAGDALIEVQDAPVHFVPAAAELPAPVSLRAIEATWVTPDAQGYLLATGTISGVPVIDFAPVLDSLTELIVTMLSSVAWGTATNARAESGNEQ